MHMNVQIKFAIKEKLHCVGNYLSTFYHSYLDIMQCYYPSRKYQSIYSCLEHKTRLGIEKVHINPLINLTSVKVKLQLQKAPLHLFSSQILKLPTKNYFCHRYLYFD